MAGRGLPKRPVDHLMRPFQKYLKNEASGGIVLMVCAAAALIAANLPIGKAYEHFWEARITILAERGGLGLSLREWINDGLMAVFFFRVGLEIKGELLRGELSSVREAALPMAAALGGMLVPAGIFLAFNATGEGRHGWGVPMATDIAFALGVLALLGSRVPLTMKVLLAAIAIVDDLGAVLVIAVFYTSDLFWPALGAAAGLLAVLGVMNRLQVRHPAPYVVLGALLWLAMHRSGVHSTIAGVLLAVMIPDRRRLDAEGFAETLRNRLDRFEADCDEGRDQLTEEQAILVDEIEAGCEAVQTPARRIEHVLDPYVAYLIMPVFALANAGVRLDSEALGHLTSRVTMGVAVGLLVGKPIGILLASWAAVRAGLCKAPEAISKASALGLGMLCGVGFTMSLFISGLAFRDELRNSEAKVGILLGSILAGIAGYVVLRWSLPADEGAESGRRGRGSKREATRAAGPSV